MTRGGDGLPDRRKHGEVQERTSEGRGAVRGGDDGRIPDRRMGLEGEAGEEKRRERGTGYRRVDAPETEDTLLRCLLCQEVRRRMTAETGERRSGSVDLAAVVDFFTLPVDDGVPSALRRHRCGAGTFRRGNFECLRPLSTLSTTS